MTKTKPLRLSIAMATYNGAKYLREQLHSFLAQTRLPDELIISDDGSTDETLNIADAFATAAPFEVKVLRAGLNLGYAGNFNRAIAATTGDLVFLSDQDDVWFSQKLERLESVAQQHPNSSVFMCDAALTDAHLNEVGLTKIGQIRSLGLSHESFVMGCCAAIRKDFLRLVMPIPTGYPDHDGWLVTIADGIGEKTVLDVPLQYYRRHDQNASQFIANSTIRVTRWDYYYLMVKELLKAAPGPKDVMETGISNVNLLREGVYRAAQKATGAQAETLTCFGDALGKKLVAMKTRGAIRTRPRLQRIPMVLKLWRGGGYANFSGIQSAVRDVLLR